MNDLPQWKSENIESLAKALVGAQRAIRPASKDSVNPHFKSKYADLTAIWEAMGPALQENGLCLTQPTFPFGDGYIVRSILMHESGQWISGDFPCFPEMNNPQKVGSSLTYARRYAAAALVGVTQDDDDAELASRGNTSGSRDRIGGDRRDHSRRNAPPPQSPSPAAKKQDSRTYAELVADAAKTCLCPARQIHDHVIDCAISSGFLGEGERDRDQVVADLTKLYLTDRSFVRETVIAYVRANKPVAA